MLLQTPDAADSGLELRILPKEPITSASPIHVRKRVIPASLKNSFSKQEELSQHNLNLSIEEWLSNHCIKSTLCGVHKETIQGAGLW
jgi:hypothetical protein